MTNRNLFSVGCQSTLEQQIEPGKVNLLSATPFISYAVPATRGKQTKKKDEAEALSFFVVTPRDNVHSLNSQGCYFMWLGRQGSNLGMPESKSGALPLGDAPLIVHGFLAKIGSVVKKKQKKLPFFEPEFSAD